MGKAISKQLAKKLYSDMWKIRRFEQEVFEFYKNGQMAGLAHLYIGEEAVAAGACAAIEARDYLGSTHRGHGHLVARGADLGRMMAEILGKKTGYSKGKGGSMHIMAMDLGILGANGIVGGGIPIATGAGYSAKYRGTDQMTLCFFGDGASNEGTFHESINMAAAWDLPVVYIIENNLYGITVDSRRVTREHDLAKRAVGYGIPGFNILFGAEVKSVNTRYSGMFAVGPMMVSKPKLISFILAAIFCGTLFFIIQKTDLGRSLRATAQDRNTSQLMGINANQVYCICFAISMALIGVSGALLTPFYSVSPYVGATFSLKSFIIVAIGGKGNISGTMAAGILIGIIEKLVGVFLGDNIAQVFIFILFIVFLLVKPNGLLSKRERT